MTFNHQSVGSNPADPNLIEIIILKTIKKKNFN